METIHPTTVDIHAARLMEAGSTVNERNMERSDNVAMKMRMVYFLLFLMNNIKDFKLLISEKVVLEYRKYILGMVNESAKGKITDKYPA
ncbi:hypothetical protein [Coprobacter sp.]